MACGERGSDSTEQESVGSGDSEEEIVDAREEIAQEEKDTATNTAKTMKAAEEHLTKKPGSEAGSGTGSGTGSEAEATGGSAGGSTGSGAAGP